MHQTTHSRVRQAYDGFWLRQFYRDTYLKPKRKGFISASLYRDRIEELLRVIRPHSLLLRNRGIHQRLSDVLQAELFSQGNEFPLSVEYEGEETFDNLKCHTLRLDVRRGKPPVPSFIVSLWLAEERNFIPVRSESYQPEWSEKLPMAISAVTQWKQIDFGMWFPNQTSLFACNNFRRDGFSENRLIVNFREDYKIRNVELEPTVALKLFQEITVPQGTNVFVLYENGKRTRYQQEQTGNLIPPENE